MKTIIALLSVSILLASAFISFAQNYDHIPLGISYQGILKASEGDTVVADGLHPMRFYIYDGETGGSLLWQQPPSGQGSQQVETKKGLFNVILGSYSDTTNDFFSNVINNDPNNRWLELEAYGELLSPRFKLFSSPFAYRSVIADSSRQSESSIYADTSFYAWSAYNADSAGYSYDGLMLGGLERSGYIEEGEPDVIDSNMIVDGSISSADIGFGAFHDAYYAYATNNITQTGDTWQDIDSLFLSVNIASDSTLAYISMNIYKLQTPMFHLHFRIIVDNVQILYTEYATGIDASYEQYSAVHLNQMVPLSSGDHIIKGQFRGNPQPYATALACVERNLMAVILK